MTVEYWRGIMDWTLDSEWLCPTCGKNEGLEWGLVHGQCRCNVCHTQFQMRADDEKKSILTIPRCMLKDEYKEPLRLAYAKYQIPINEMNDGMIDEFMPLPPSEEKHE